MPAHNQLVAPVFTLRMRPGREGPGVGVTRWRRQPPLNAANASMRSGREDPGTAALHGAARQRASPSGFNESPGREGPGSKPSRPTTVRLRRFARFNAARALRPGASSYAGIPILWGYELQ